MPDSSGPEIVRYLHVGTELAVLVAIGTWLGYKLDQAWESEPWCLVGGAALGFALGMYNLIRETTRSS